MSEDDDMERKRVLITKALNTPAGRALALASDQEGEDFLLLSQVAEYVGITVPVARRMAKKLDLPRTWARLGSMRIGAWSLDDVDVLQAFHVERKLPPAKRWPKK